MKVENDPHLLSAGQCFMFLCWVESSMRDFVVLNDGGEEMRARYNTGIRTGKHPPDFSRKRLEIGVSTFGTIKNRFLQMWPEWKTQQDVHEAIERVVIWRNAFGHAQIQPFRPYLLYTPNTKSWEAIQRYMRCPTCLKYRQYCQCPKDDFVDPITIKMPCLDETFLVGLYGDIKTVDVQCFLKTAQVLRVRYQGIAWPRGDGSHISRHPRDRAG